MENLGRGLVAIHQGDEKFFSRGDSSVLNRMKLLSMCIAQSVPEQQ
jgi:hypothetical protein